VTSNLDSGIEQIISDLTKKLGDTTKAKAVVDTVIDELDDSFTEE